MCLIRGKYSSFVSLSPSRIILEFFYGSWARIWTAFFSFLTSLDFSEDANGEFSLNSDVLFQKGALEDNQQLGASLVGIVLARLGLAEGSVLGVSVLLIYFALGSANPWRKTTLWKIFGIVEG